jgi:hypothetical protein
MERFYNKRHCSTYRKRSEKKRTNAFNNDDADADDIIKEDDNCSDDEISKSLR